MVVGRRTFPRVPGVEQQNGRGRGPRPREADRSDTAPTPVIPRVGF